MERLKSILQFINEDDIVADIGCDHGYLLELAIKNKNLERALECCIPAEVYERIRKIIVNEL